MKHELIDFKHLLLQHLTARDMALGRFVKTPDVEEFIETQNNLYEFVENIIIENQRLKDDFDNVIKLSDERAKEYDKKILELNRDVTHLAHLTNTSQW